MIFSSVLRSNIGKTPRELENKYEDYVSVTRPVLNKLLTNFQALGSKVAEWTSFLSECPSHLSISHQNRGNYAIDDASK